jgi:hypothetical protein
MYSFIPTCTKIHDEPTVRTDSILTVQHAYICMTFIENPSLELIDDRSQGYLLMRSLAPKWPAGRHQKGQKQNQR